jgi:hypothetical protein
MEGETVVEQDDQEECEVSEKLYEVWGISLRTLITRFGSC